MSLSRRKSVIAVLGVIALGALGFEAAQAFSGSGSPKTPVAAATSPSPSVGATTPADPGTATSGGPDGASPATATPTSPASPSKPDSTGPGVFASDGVTPLADFPSLQRIAGRLNGTTHLTTTIDPKVQRAAAAALGTYGNAAMVVIQPSTGNILGVAFRGSTDPLLAELQPGSTFKIVTTEDLLRHGLTVDTPAPCVAKDPKFGFHNDEASLTTPGATLGWAFVNSCNTSFVGLMGQAGSLNEESTTYFGLNQPWDLGLGPATYGAAGATNVPKTTVEADFAQEMFGQGPMTMSPLNMASVAATVAQGRFHQPVLIPGLKPIAGATPLDGGIDRTLKSLMTDTVTKGTAMSLRGIPGVGAKTGTAEPGPGRPDNSWMVAFRGDVAVACVVEGGGHGDQAAGPAIASLLKAIG